MTEIKEINGVKVFDTRFQPNKDNIPQISEYLGITYSSNLVDIIFESNPFEVNYLTNKAQLDDALSKALDTIKNLKYSKVCIDLNTFYLDIVYTR